MEDKKSVFASYYMDKLELDDALEDHEISERVEEYYNEKYGANLKGMIKELYRDVTLVLDREGITPPAGHEILGFNKYLMIYFNESKHIGAHFHRGVGGQKLRRWKNIHSWEIQKKNK
ncbi:MAG: hypothetical protein GOV00_02155 [Candidatus Altiarchaeota archaeon]|nr:hypothetical protein [Candidatus Altiarchaeota archaeon]